MSEEKDKTQAVYTLIYERKNIVDLETFNCKDYESLKKEYDKITSALMLLPVSIISTHLLNNFIFNLNLEFEGFDYVWVEYKSETLTLVKAGLNLDYTLYDNILQIITWLELNKFKINMLKSKYTIPACQVEINSELEK